MSWFEPGPQSSFGLTELPYGIGARLGHTPGVQVAIGDQALDLAALWRTLDLDPGDFEKPSLNTFLARGPTVWRQTRTTLQELLANPSGHELLEPHLTPADALELRLPFEVADYVDFYASRHHAGNVGRIFRPGSEPLTPNWSHMPIGYHGRAGSVIVSGTPVRRPQGQTRPAPAAALPGFGASAKLDIEAELGWVVGVGSEPGEPVSLNDFREHVFGVVVLNDWSARDIQAWEYVPLGPFLGKSFATSISAWVLPLDALDDAAVPLPDAGRPLSEYLRGGEGYDIDVQVWRNGLLISTCPYATMTYSPAQMLAHLTVNGAWLRPGDLYGSGTISGPEPDQRGSLLELTDNGERGTFLADGDEVVLRAVSRGGARLGEVRGTILPALGSVGASPTLRPLVASSSTVAQELADATSDLVEPVGAEQDPISRGE